MQKLSSDRVQVIDVLRGFALMCILFIHSADEFAGWSSIYISPVGADSLSTSLIDSAVNFFLNLFLVGKARTLFAFLFGVGFYFQLSKAGRNGYRIEGKFAKRMLMLFLIGVLHAYLIWSGDILRMYAVCGLLLLLVYKWKPKQLFIAAIVCSVVVPAVFTALHYYFPYGVLSNEMKAQMYNGYAGDDYSGLLHANLLRDEAINLDPYSLGAYLLPVLGNFIFGYWAAQKKLIEKLIGNKTWLVKCMMVSGITGVLCSNNAVRLAARLFHSDESHIPVYGRSLLALPAIYSIEAIAFFLLCLIVYLYEFTRLKRMLFFITFAGRMTLTNYILQSVFAVVVFFGFGFGLISHYGSFVSLCFGLVFFAMQLIYSYVWLQYFTMGPVEFLWRSMIDGKWLKIRHPESIKEMV